MVKATAAGLAVALFIAGISMAASQTPAGGQTGRPAGPDWVAVQHILIGFKGSIPDAKVTVTQTRHLFRFGTAGPNGPDVTVLQERATLDR